MGFTADVKCHKYGLCGVMFEGETFNFVLTSKKWKRRYDPLSMDDNYGLTAWEGY